MAYQVSGEPPFDTQIAANAMMSSASLTGCPSWDSHCGVDPLRNLNAIAAPPGAPGQNGEAPYNDIWSDNTYRGPWAWNAAYLFGTCYPVPANLPAVACGPLDLAEWRADWQQDAASRSR